MDIPYYKIDKAEMPPGLGTLERPWFWYTFALTGDEKCARPECPSVAHAGLVFMKEGDKGRWQEAQDSEDVLDADIVFYCANDFIPAVTRLTKSPK